MGAAVIALCAMPTRAQIPDELLRRLLPPGQEDMRRDEHERQEERERREEFRERQGVIRRDDFRERQDEIREAMFRLREECERGDRRACVRFGMILGRNQDREAEWRRERPEYFWWER
jgi:hypothetical protein